MSRENLELSTESAEAGPLRRISFKYRSGPAALRCLNDGAAYFASPAELNDCLEAKFDHCNEADYIACMDRAIQGIAQQHGGVGGYTVPDCKLASHAANYARDNAAFTEATQRVGIYATATRPDSQPMWAYYCDSSRGFCFELEWSDEVLGQYQIAPVGVQYSSDARVHNRAGIFEKLLREEADMHPDWPMARILEEAQSDFFRFRFQMLNICRATSIKHKDWAHEHEVRFISPRAGPLPIMGSVLKRVYYVRTDFPEWGPVITLLHKLYPNVELAELTFQHTEPNVSMRHMIKRLVPID
jgi:hypothetical protein